MSCQKNGECLADHKHIPLANHQFSHDEIPFFAGPHPYWSWPLWKKNLGEKTKENDLLMTYLWHLMIYLWPTFIIFSIVIFQHHLPRRSSLWIPLGGSYQARAAQPMSQPWSTWVNLGAPQNPPHFWASSAEHWPTGDGSKPWYPCSSHQNGW